MKTPRCRWLAMACLSLLPLLSLRAATVTEVSYQSGNGLEPPRELIDATVKTRKNTVFDPRQLNEDMKSLMKTGNFSDVETSCVPDGPETVKVIFFVKPVAVLSEVELVGANLISESKIRKELVMVPGMSANLLQVANDVDAIRKVYANKGYYKTEVSYELSGIDITTRSAKLSYLIREQPRYKLSRIEFTGNSHFDSSELRDKLISKATWWSYIFNTGYVDPTRLELDRGTIRNSYLEDGYLDCQIPHVEDNHYDTNQHWVTVKFRISEGARYTVSSVSVKGNVRFADKELPALKIKPGCWYGEKEVRADTEAIENLYGKLGYADIKVESDRLVDTTNHTVVLTYRITEGTVSRVNNITISGNKKTKEKVLRRELSLHPGDLVDKGKMKLDNDRLMNMNYFEEVDFVPVSTGTEELKDLQLRVKEKYTGQFSLGGGYSLDDSAMAFAEWSQTNFDLFGWGNGFTGAGQRFRARAQVGTLNSNFLVSFTEPWLFDRRLSLQTDFYSDSRYEETYTNTVYGSDISLTKPFIGSWRQRVGVGIHQYNIDSRSGASAQIQRQDGSYIANNVNLTFFRNTRNPTILPRRGSYLSIGATYTPEMLGSYMNWVRGDATGTLYLPVTSNSTLKLNLEGSALWTPDGEYEPNGDLRVGIFDRLFAGGGYDIRGFKRREIGPQDSRDEALGGMARIVANAEYMYFVHKSFALCWFIDAGNVWETASDVGADLNISTGMGVQLTTPGFPIRLDYGIPLHTTWDHLSGNTGRFHFSMSTSF
jgi:outer membrane protein insertion porin family